MHISKPSSQASVRHPNNLKRLIPFLYRMAEETASDRKVRRTETEPESRPHAEEIPNVRLHYLQKSDVPEGELETRIQGLLRKVVRDEREQ